MLLGEIAQRLGLALEDAAAGQVEIHGAASLLEAGPEEISFFADARYQRVLARSEAGAVLVPRGFTGKIKGVALRCDEPAEAFARVLEWFQPKAVEWPAGIHPTAVVAPGAEVHPSVYVGPGVVVEEGARIGARSVVMANCYVGHEARIGEDCHLHPNVVVGERCVLGHRVILHAGVVIGADGFGYEFKDGRQRKIPQTGIVQIDDDVEIGANSCVDRARFGRTHIGEGVKIDNLVQIGHNVKVGAHTVLCAQVGISGSTRVGRYVVMAGKVGVTGHVEIADQVKVAAMAGVSGPISQPGAVYCGLPAVPMKFFKRTYARLNQIEKIYQRLCRVEQALGLEALPVGLRDAGAVKEEATEDSEMAS